jgi:hypothetical protein
MFKKNEKDKKTREKTGTYSLSRPHGRSAKMELCTTTGDFGGRKQHTVKYCTLEEKKVEPTVGITARS